MRLLGARTGKRRPRALTEPAPEPQEPAAATSLGLSAQGNAAGSAAVDEDRDLMVFLREHLTPILGPILKGLCRERPEDPWDYISRRLGAGRDCPAPLEPIKALGPHDYAAQLQPLLHALALSALGCATPSRRPHGLAAVLGECLAASSQDPSCYVPAGFAATSF